MNEAVLTATDGPVTVLTLNRPSVRNAIDRETRQLFTDALHAAGGDAEVAAIVITGTDPAFCAGVDFKALADSVESGPPPGSNPGEAVRASRKPVVAAVNGACVTGGLEIALSCDLVVASTRASFADTHAKLGLSPGPGMWGLSALLPEAVGIRLAKELSLTGRFLQADEALRCGLVNHVVEHERLLPFAVELAATIAARDRVVVSAWLDAYDRAAGESRERALEMEQRAVQPGVRR